MRARWVVATQPFMRAAQATCLMACVLLGSVRLEAGPIVADRLIPEKPLAGQWVYDPVGLMDESSKQRVNEFLSVFRQDTGIEFFAVSIPGFSGFDINTFTHDLFEQWKIGERTKGRGLLFVIAAEAKLVRLEVGYALEPMYTDAFVSYIEHEQMVPFFEQGRVGDGFEATLELIVQRFQESKKQGVEPPTAGREDTATDYLSGGAGVKTGVVLGRRVEPKKETLPTDVKSAFAAQASPEATFALYLEHDHRHLTDPDLGIFTPATRTFFKQWTVTNAQMDNEYRTYSGKRYEVYTEADRAVIRFPVEERTLSPFFLQRSVEGWQLDFATMSQAIRVNTNNQWHFASLSHSYMFAFTDWSFDQHGFPHEEAPHASSGVVTR